MSLNVEISYIHPVVKVCAPVAQGACLISDAVNVN